MSRRLPRSGDPVRIRISVVVCLALLSLRCGSDGGPITVPDDPFIGLSETIKSFSGTQGAAGPAPQTVAITNEGEGTLSGLATAVSYTPGQAEGWLTAELSATTAPSTLTLTATTGSLAPGGYAALVEVSSAGANNSPQPVGVNFTVLPEAAGATMVLSSTSQNFTSLQGGPNPAAQTVEVSNGGGGALDGLTAEIAYTAGQPSGWLTAGLSVTTAPSILTLTAATGSLTAGTYTASVAVGSAVADNSPQTLDVTFTIAPPTAGPIISLSSDNRSFSATQGGANPGPRNVEISNGGGGTLSGLEANITYTSGQPTGWLAAVLSAGTAPSTLRLTATTGSLAVGTYRATVAVTSAVADNSPQTASVTFTVRAPPQITLSSTSQTFSVLQGGGNPAAHTVEVSNGGGGALGGLTTEVSYTVGQPTGWLNADLNRTTAPSTLTLAVTTGTLTAGTYDASVALRSAVASNSPQVVRVTFTVQPVAAGPVIALSRPTLRFSVVEGGGNPAGQTVEVTNGGGGTLSSLTTEVSYEAGQPTGWLAADLSGTTAASTLTLMVTTGSLTAGTYSASVEVASSVASNSPQAISVTVTVTAPAPLIALSPTSLSFSAEQGGPDPEEQSVEVTNGGGGTLDGLTANVTYIVTPGQPSGWLTAGLSVTTAPSILTLTAATGSLTAGTYRAGVFVKSAVASNSPQTVSVTITVTLPPPPDAPSGLTAMAASTSQINLTWTDNASNEEGFRIERCTGDGCTDYAEITTVEADGTSYQSIGLAASTTYRYQMRAYNSGGTSEYSNSASATVLSAWTTQAPMPTPRSYPAIGVVNGILYVAGGSSTNGAVMTTVEAYNPATNTWTTKAPMPTARGAAATGVVNGILYVVGGSFSASQLATVEAYNPATNTWTTRTAMPTPRSGAAAGVVNGVLYVVGGYHAPGGSPGATIEAYNPATNTWTTKAAMPTARGAAGAGVVNDILYVAGGNNSNMLPATLATVEAYDPAANTWTTKAAMPTRRYWVAGDVVNGILYIAGGLSLTAKVEAYDPSSNTWTTNTAMPTPRWGARTGVVNGTLYVAGGRNTVTVLDRLEALRP